MICPRRCSGSRGWRLREDNKDMSTKIEFDPKKFDDWLMHVADATISDVDMESLLRRPATNLKVKE